MKDNRPNFQKLYREFAKLLGELCIFALELGTSTRFPSSLGSNWFPAKSALANSKLWRANHNNVIQLYLGRYTCFIATLTDLPDPDTSSKGKLRWQFAICGHRTIDAVPTYYRRIINAL
eukprot:sb/3476302/